MTKQSKIEAIEQKILNEHRKYFQMDGPVDWAKSAAVKIYSMFDQETVIKTLEETDHICESLQQFYGSNK